MSQADIENLSEKDVLVLGEAILKATNSRGKISSATLRKLKEPLRKLAASAYILTKEEHTALSKKIERLIASDASREMRSLRAEDLREILMKINSGGTTLLSVCEDLFDVAPTGLVLLYPGDNFNIANSVCPAGSNFYLMSGTYTGQTVSNSKTGNSWVGGGTNPIIMDGQNSVNRAFNGGMNENIISWFEIKNYAEHGLYSSGVEGVLVHHMTFSEIGAGKSGQDFGAIKFDYAEDIEVSYSYFENVTSSIRYRFSDGPLKVLNNEALNSGRNFFQCGNCSGGGIRINGNSMVYTSNYGSDQLEDWINLFKTEGLPNDYVEVNHNRAKGNALNFFFSIYKLG